MTKSIVISSGHGKYVRGASGYLDEVDEARRVVAKVAEYLFAAGCPVKTFNDDVSTTQNQNLQTIVNYHNAQQRDLDVSVHFNAYSTTSKPMGTECLYVTQSALAGQVASATAKAGGFINRGAKKRTDLYFLNNTAKPAILQEVCFVDSSSDASLYHANFDAICRAMAESIGGVKIPTEPPPVDPPTEPVDPEPEPPIEPAPEPKPVLQKGSNGPYVLDVQQRLYTTPYDSDFGDLTDRAVKGFQRGVELPANGIVDAQTWAELDKLLPPALTVLTQAEIDAICDVAINSDIYGYSWNNRGRAPQGFMCGIAVSYGQALKLKDSAFVIEVSRAAGNSETDALAWYSAEFAARGMSNAVAGIDTLRHVYVFLMGLGMRESSGKYCEGRDTSASNVTSDTAEAGLFQTSWNARSCSAEMQVLFDKYASVPSLGYLEVFTPGVSCSASSWKSYGSGNGYKFQEMCKHQPSFAVETAAVVIRNLRKHYGPINRREVEIRTDADAMFQQIENVLAGAAVA